MPGEHTVHSGIESNILLDALTQIQSNLHPDSPVLNLSAPDDLLLYLSAL